ncbi:MAG: aminoglycoside phosphotransferase family protein [Phycisphaeraceae bacterium]|nr:aminoglycoside phosphotransferase family protein [Phycisphaeraceae bacterium]
MTEPIHGTCGPATPTGLSGSRGQALGSSLGAVLRDLLDGRLGPIEWFQSTWQRGETATGFSTWALPDGRRTPVMLKIPVGPNEHSWSVALGAVEQEDWDAPESLERPTARVAAAGESLGGYDLGWLVLERFPGLPLAGDLGRQGVLDMAGAAARFHASAARARPVGSLPDEPDWTGTIEHSVEVARDYGMADEERWAAATERVLDMLPDLVSQWAGRARTTWCHGDLHPGNVMWRSHPDGTRRCALIDLALVHAGHWIEDGLYFERLYWGHDSMLGGAEPVAALAKERARLGLTVEPGYERLADVRRVLMAACVPSALIREGNLSYVKGALDILEATLARLS